ADVARRKTENYLGQLRDALADLPAAEARDIVEEIRSHIRDCAQGGGELASDQVDATLARLGSPSHLAALYSVESLARRARGSGSLWLALQTLVGWARLSLEGIWVLCLWLAGVALASALMIGALAKPFNPGRVGLWRLAGDEGSWSLHLGFREAPQGTEVLGWWIIPLGLLLGAGLVRL